ncbi:DUF3515 family protein [Streptomyces sp. NPDC051940]|uniref:DUF3515 family protein n=1 Tax=Streptomyces sp. NPDC051940 TaxID=3155675 RepID=UPI0034253597
MPSARPAVLLLAVALTAACSSSSDGGAADVSAPRPSAGAKAYCEALAKRLPRTVGDGLKSRETSPASVYTAAWGDPAVTLRCGVPRPDVLTPGTEHYNPTADAAQVDGVDWLLEDTDEGYRFTTVGRAAFVEVAVPERYAPEIGMVAGGISAGVKSAVPAES